MYRFKIDRFSENKNIIIMFSPEGFRFCFLPLWRKILIVRSIEDAGMKTKHKKRT